MHPIIANSPDLFYSALASESNVFKLALRFESIFMQELNMKVDIVVSEHKLGWEYFFSSPKDQYRFSIVLNGQLIDQGFQDDKYMKQLKAFVKDQIDKDWPVSDNLLSARVRANS